MDQTHAASAPATNEKLKTKNIRLFSLHLLASIKPESLWSSQAPEIEIDIDRHCRETETEKI